VTGGGVVVGEEVTGAGERVSVLDSQPQESGGNNQSGKAEGECQCQPSHEKE